MLRVLFSLISTLFLVVGHPIAGDSQTTIVGEPSSGYPGWFDPRVNGGRFLDVRPRSGDVGLICAANH